MLQYYSYNAYIHYVPQNICCKVCYWRALSIAPLFHLIYITFMCIIIVIIANLSVNLEYTNFTFWNSSIQAFCISVVWECYIIIVMRHAPCTSNYRSLRLLFIVKWIAMNRKCYDKLAAVYTAYSHFHVDVWHLPGKHFLVKPTFMKGEGPMYRRD